MTGKGPAVSLNHRTGIWGWQTCWTLDYSTQKESGPGWWIATSPQGASNCGCQAPMRYHFGNSENISYLSDLQQLANQHLQDWHTHNRLWEHCYSELFLAYFLKETSTLPHLNYSTPYYSFWYAWYLLLLLWNLLLYKSFIFHYYKLTYIYIWYLLRKYMGKSYFLNKQIH